jgi:multiple sugar transport system permease protein
MNSNASIFSRRQLARGLSTALLVLAALAIVVFVLFPYGWLILNSLRPEKDFVIAGVSYTPSSITLANFAELFRRHNFARYFTNSFIVAASTTLLSQLVAVCAAFAFSRFRFKGRNPLRMLVLLVYMFPAVLLLIPLFIIMRDLRLLNTYPSLILAHATSAVPFSIWLLAAYFDAIPRDLEEAAMVDGANVIQSLIHIALPLATPGIVATSIFMFIVSWNEFLYALTFLFKTNMQTLPVALWNIIGGETRYAWGVICASGVATSLPVAILFMIFQRQLITGLTAGAVKG